jgi:prefoldin subunit 5
MNMTQTAKSLVFANLVLAVVFVAWAIGLATNPVPWHTPPAGEGPKVEGMVAQLKGQIDRLVVARDSADQQWGDAYAQLQQVEKQRADAQKYEADLLRSARSGDVTDIKPPVQQLVFNGTVLDISKRSGRPPVTINSTGENALSIAGYHQKIQQTLDEIQKAQAEITRLMTETETLTKQINGVTPGNPAAPTLDEKGLRVQIQEQQDMVKGLEAEQQYLRSPLTYFTVQRDQLRQRQAALTARLEELKAAPAGLGKK